VHDAQMHLLSAGYLSINNSSGDDAAGGIGLPVERGHRWPKWGIGIGGNAGAKCSGTAKLVVLQNLEIG
jgi:hypothetical protein